MASTAQKSQQVVSREDWTSARKALLKKEKALTQMLDMVSAERQAMPWERVEKHYVFDAQDGEKTLADLFDGKSQLVVHHLMFAPDWDAGCPSCSFQAEHIDGPAVHLEQRDVKIVAVSRAPIDKLAAYKRRMGWRFDWVSSNDGDFNYDFGVAFSDDDIARGEIDYNFGTIRVDPRYLSKDLPGISVFYKNAEGEIFHTWSTYARGLDMLLGANHYLDVTPKGRGNAAPAGWPKRHDEYPQNEKSDACCDGNLAS